MVNPTAFLRDKSSSVKETTQEAKVAFGSGALEGRFEIDSLRLGKDCEDPAIEEMKFGMAEKVHGFKGIAFNSIIGMAYNTLAQPGVTPLFDKLIETRQLDKNWFSFYLVDMQEE